jgi:hypothetical protein
MPLERPRHRRHRGIGPACVLTLGLVNLGGCGRESRTAAPPQPAARGEPAPAETAAKPAAPPAAGEAAPKAAPEPAAARPSSGAISKANGLRERARAQRRAGRTRDAYDTLNAAWDALQADAGDAESKPLGQALLGELDEVSRELDASRGDGAPGDLSSKPLITR